MRADRDGDADELVAAARDGAAWALTEIWTRYAPVVHGYLATRGATEPEDLTSEVFLAVFRQLRRFKGGEPELRAFIFTVAHHRVVDDRRQRARRPATVEFVPDGDTRTNASAEDAALTRLGTQRAHELLDSLPPDQRDVLLLRVLGDLTLEQTSSVLGKRVEAVKAAQHRALARLRKILDQAVSL